MITQIDRVQKLITFSPQLYELIERNAKKLGISFPEYIRVLAVNDVKKAVEEAMYLDKETEEQVAKSLKDAQKGDYTKVVTEDELDNHLKSL